MIDDKNAKSEGNTQKPKPTKPPKSKQQQKVYRSSSEDESNENIDKIKRNQM
jgi:hypothetical protein